MPLNTVFVYNYVYMFTIRLADIDIAIENDELTDFFKDYLSEEAPLFTVSANSSDILKEKEKSEFIHRDIEYLKLAVYRKIAERLPMYDAFLVHGSALYVNDSKAVLLSGISGSGKSTHASLLREYFNAEMINDDKPLIRIINSIPYVYGTPYDGKHHLSQNISKPLGNIIFIRQAEENSIRELDKDESFQRIFSQVYRPTDKEALKHTLELCDMLNQHINTYELSCTISKEAAMLSYNIIR